MTNTIQQYFLGPIIVALVGFIAVWYQAGMSALFIVIILSILEVTLSFDNAVVNAKVLARMSPIWQKRFLTWGILVAVFGTRLVLPILIVSVAAWASPIFISKLAVMDPVAYGELLEGVRGAITAFGGIFLLMVSLKYFFDVGKSVHFIARIEQHFVKWGRMEALEIAIAIAVLIGLSFISPFDQASILVAGFIGLLLFIIMEGISSSISLESSQVAKGGLALFLYLNVLDSAFSLDGVVGAFALSSNLLIIVTGLGIGAYFVRSFTVYMVARKTLAHLVYLEQGAHWAILGLSIAMLANLVIHVPEIITGLVGLFCVSVAYYASIKEARSNR
ncbi:DUF475 domain-containing protein [Patescibacteria group bacterium]|nr:DUF475 domain-containing protein [Patescibacteria group bacterium]